MRTCVDVQTGEVLWADALPEKPRRNSLRCRNPQCGERVVHVNPKAASQHFRHAPGVADLETCFYSWEEPTERQYASIGAVQAWLTSQYPQATMRLEEWGAGISWPLDILLTHGDGRRWGFWYVSTRRLKVTKDLIRECQAAGIHLIVFTHSELRQPRDIFGSPPQVAFSVNPATATLFAAGASGPIAAWRLDDNGQLVAPRVEATPESLVPVQVQTTKVPFGEYSLFRVPEDYWQQRVLEHFSTTYLRNGKDFGLYEVARYMADQGWLAPGRQWQDLEILLAMLQFWRDEEKRGKVTVRRHGLWTVYPRVPA